MEYMLKKPNPITTTAKEIFAMEETHKLTVDMEAQDLGIIAYLDLINYQNGHSFDPPLMTRNAMFWMGLCLPATAYIDPKKTRQSIYYLYSAHNNIAKPYLSDSAHAMESEHMSLIEKGMSAALYRLLSGRNDLDQQLREYAAEILRVFERNAYIQKAWAIDTVIGKFEVMPTLMGLMVLEICDKVFGSGLAAIKENVLEFIETKLIDQKSGLFVKYYNTGYMGYPGEITSEGVVWHSDELSAGSIGLALPLYHYFAGDKAAVMWEKYKEVFAHTLTAVTAEEITATNGTSFVTALGSKGEDLFGALMAAKDFADEVLFAELQDHVYKVGNPNLWEGQVHYAGFGEYAHFVGAFAHLARIHIPWKKLIQHDWEKYYDWDFFTN